MTRKIGIITFFTFLMFCKAHGYDTLRITLRQADSIFLQFNYRLLAAAMNIDAQRAQVIQASLYPNPVFSAELNGYDPENRKPFHIDASGQMGFQFEQLLLLGGKRKATIDLAKTNSVIAELQFQELIRQLKFQLHTSLHALNQQRFLLDKYNGQLILLDTILTAYEAQAVKGNIALKEIVRLKGVYLNLNNDRAELLKLYYEEQAKVQTILEQSAVVVPIVTESDLQKVIKSETFARLNQIATENRPDYLIAENNKIAADQYYTIQRKLSLPDINLMTSYDRRGGAFNNQINVGFGIPIPIWNRNQGNIRSAKFLIQEAEYSGQGLRNEISIQLQNNLALYNQTVSEYEKTARLYNDDFEATLKGMIDNFQKRNVSLIEFVDFFEAYNNALAEIARIKIQLATSAEQLNLTIGKEVY